MNGIDFAGRVAIVTGAGGGLGRDYALGLAARGAAVVVNNIGETPDGLGGGSASAEAVVAEIRAAGGQAVEHIGSVADPGAGEARVALALERFGRLDILINNAGNQRNNRFELMSEAEFDDVMAVHLKGAFHVSQPAYRVMLEQGYGRLLFTSSASGLFGNYIRANYAAAKAGAVGLMRAIAIEGAGRGVLANAILPVAASRLGRAPVDAMLPEWEGDDPRNLSGMELIGPAMTTPYVTPLALYLCSEQCRASHQLWSAVAGRYARVFIGATRGWLAPAGAPPSVEDIAAHLGEIVDSEGFDEPMSVTQELAAVIAAYRARQV